MCAHICNVLWAQALAAAGALSGGPGLQVHGCTGGTTIWLMTGHSMQARVAFLDSLLQYMVKQGACLVVRQGVVAVVCRTRWANLLVGLFVSVSGSQTCYYSHQMVLLNS